MKVDPDSSSQGAVISFVRGLGLVGDSKDVRICEIEPGVSSNIWLVTDGDARLVVKQPLTTLRAASPWTAPISRSHFEAQWLRFAAEIIPGRVPAVLGNDPSLGMLAMEYLPPDEYVLWKRRLLAGETRAEVAAAVGRALAATHSASAADPAVRRRFRARTELQGTRLYPYFDYVAKIHPDLGSRIAWLRHSVLHSSAVVVHGDVTPKNILVGKGGPVLLDAECACIGDPAFDIAFFLALLCVKCAHQPAYARGYVECARTFVDEYSAGVDWEEPEDVGARAVPLLGLFMLGRVDGLARVEYLRSPGAIAAIRGLGRGLVAGGHSTSLAAIFDELLQTSPEGVAGAALAETPAAE